MPSLNSRTISARLNNELADSFAAVAQGKGYSPAGFMVELARRAVYSCDDDEPEPDDELPEISTRLYSVALNLIDDLTEAGYPAGEIESALTGIRRTML